MTTAQRVRSALAMVRSYVGFRTATWPVSRQGIEAESTDPRHSVHKHSCLKGRLVYGKNDPFRSWPISANELEEVTMGSETNV
jgi:hypothetical protein